MAAKKTNAPDIVIPDVDAMNARGLARRLGGLASILERGLPSGLTPAEVETEMDVLRLAREKIRRVTSAWYGLDASTEAAADNRKRDRTLSIIRIWGNRLKQNQLAPMELADGALDEAAEEVTIRVWASLGYDYADRLFENTDLIKALLLTYCAKPGGRGKRSLPGQSRPELVEKLCKIMGWTGNTAAIRQAKKRRSGASKKT